MRDSGVSFLVFTLTMLVMISYIRVHLRGTALESVRVWRRTVLRAFVVNCVSFFVIALAFKMLYGFITDDINYYRVPENFVETNFFKLRGPSQTLWWIVRPLRRGLGFDIPSFHILFGAFGFIGSLNFLKIYTLISDMRSKAYYRHNMTALWAFLCFPNFMAWGRFFGKDSYTLFFASVFCLGAAKILLDKGPKISSLIWMPVSFYMAYRVRPHIAGALMIAFFMALVLKTQGSRISQNVGLQALAKLYGLPMLLGIAMLTTYLTLARFTGDDVSVESTQRFLVSTSRMGAYGGSATGLRDELDENPGLIFRPAGIAMNMLNLLFAPMPWQVRGPRDIIAFIANVLLIWLLIKFRGNIRLTGVFNRYLFLNVVVLSVILSFTAGNVGLMLRQKTIILPFLFLLLFSREGKPELSVVSGNSKSPDRQPAKRSPRPTHRPQPQS